MNNEIIFFEDEEIRLEVNMKDEMVWLTQKQMAKLFDRDVGVISRHIKNVLKEELKGKSNLQKMQIPNSDKPIILYDLDIIIGVGYRVKSKRGITFRRWATKVLKEHLIQGYTINQKRLEQLEKTVRLIEIADSIKTNDKSKEIISIINNYSKALNLLTDYDNKEIIKPKGNKSNLKISYEECKTIINKLDYRGNLFGLERDKGLQSIINDIYQTYNNKELYQSIEEKASNLLYLIIKNHIFIDGNKRIAATIFIYFLNKHNILYKNNKKVIDNNTLVSLTILIAESNPNDKNILIDLIMNFLCN